MSRTLTVTETGETFLIRTGQNSQVAVMVDLSSTLDGAFTVACRPTKISGSASPIAPVLLEGGSLAAGKQQRFFVGRDMDVVVEHVGGTSPSIGLVVSLIP